MMLYEDDSHRTYQHRAVAVSKCLSQSIRQLAKHSSKRSPALTETSRLAEISDERREQSVSFEDPEETVLYLAYGSNLSIETFRGKRGIQPLSQMNVQVPELRLTFDLPGVAYAEPCFANTARRNPDEDTPRHSHDQTAQGADYHKDRWHKGLIGVVYEVTPDDYAHIIATEGAGSAYHDVLVDCYPFASSAEEPVPQFPLTKPFKAHTLFAPAAPPGEKIPRDGGRLQRPDTAYAQASARYLKLITDGAAECRLPYEYQDYLKDLQPFTITSNKQRLGQFIFLSIWGPIILFLINTQSLFTDDQGVAPEWMKVLTGALFQASWASYDNYFKDVFGEGERTVPKDKSDDEEKLQSNRKKRSLGGQKDDLSEKDLLEV